MIFSEADMWPIFNLCLEESLADRWQGTQQTFIERMSKNSLFCILQVYCSSGKSLSDNFPTGWLLHLLREGWAWGHDLSLISTSFTFFFVSLTPKLSSLSMQDCAFFSCGSPIPGTVPDMWHRLNKWLSGEGSDPSVRLSLVWGCCWTLAHLGSYEKASQWLGSSGCHLTRSHRSGWSWRQDSGLFSLCLGLSFYVCGPRQLTWPCQPVQSMPS